MYEKIVIIGAPRSGTNMLRDLLVMLPGVGTWPCDEINYIWRHGNMNFPSDVFVPNMASNPIKQYINQQFDKFAARHDFNIIIEKTCANSLRVGFVNEIVPDAKYIFIVRDGIDVVASAMLRWTASLDIRYLVKKARYVPLCDLPYYFTNYLGNRIHRLISKEKRLATWGPKLDNMKEVFSSHPLDEACAIQWASCVNHAERDFQLIPAERLLRVRYEDFVSAPVPEFERITQFVGCKIPEGFELILKRNVSSSSVGRGYQQLGSEVTKRLLPLIHETMERYGYKS